MVVAEFIALILGLLLFVPLLFALIIHQWRKTPYGLLEFRTAFFLRILRLFRRFRVDLEGSVEKNRANILRNALLAQGRKEEVFCVEESAFPGPGGEIKIRLYTPEDREDLPILLYYHGGGMVFGCIDTHDGVCRSLANTCRAVIVSVEYRLAPENPYPAAVEDAYAALLWAARGELRADSAKIIVAGDSAGGNLAAVVSLMARDQKGPEISLQVLIYPVTNISATDTPSYIRFETGYGLTMREVKWFRSQYLPRKEDWTHPHASPLLAESHAALPPALIVAAEFDVLSSEAEAYGEALRKAGVPAKYVCYPGMVHGFISMGRFLRQSGEAVRLIAGEVDSRQRR
jgi:acetyl esterase